MRSPLLLLSPLCFATRVSAVDDSGISHSFISPSMIASLGLGPYTEGLRDIQNFLISVEAPLSYLKSPESNTMLI